MVAISVIVPCYNHGQYIAECLDSVLAQSFVDFEVIVVNDGSTDNSLQVIEEYVQKDPRVRLINQVNKGVVSARNSALHESQGTYIYPLDGDDKIAPECLGLLYDAINANLGDVIYSEVAFFGAYNGVMKLDKPTKLSMAQENRVVCSALYRKKDAIAYGGYDENMREGIEDWEFWCNFIYDNKTFYKIEKILFYYRKSGVSRNTSFDKNVKKKLKKYICKKHNIYFYLFMQNIRRFLYQSTITSKKKRLVKICKIPVYYRNVK